MNRKVKITPSYLIRNCGSAGGSSNDTLWGGEVMNLACCPIFLGVGGLSRSTTMETLRSQDSSCEAQASGMYYQTDGRTDVGKTRKISQEEGISWRTRSNRTHSQQTKKNLSEEEAEITFNLLIKIAINLMMKLCVNCILFEIRQIDGISFH